MIIDAAGFPARAEKREVFSLIRLSTKPFGTLPDGRAVTAYTMTNDAGMSVTALNWGAVIQSILVPTPRGAVDVALGYPDLEGYLVSRGHLGALIGRNANRLGGAFIEIDGRRYPVTANNGENQLHGGKEGFDKKLFTAREIEGGFAFSYTSPDGEEGFPGEVSLTASYTLDEAGALTLDYRAVSTKDTVVNLTNHSYFNLNGGGDAMGHLLRVNASAIAAADASSLPTGELRPVAGTPFDFADFHTLAERIDQPDDQLGYAGGYDHNFVLDKAPGALAEAAVLKGEQSGITLTCSTTCPGMQLYTANGMDPSAAPGKLGRRYLPRESVCLETQYFPNYNNLPAFPQPVLRAGGEYHEVTVYAFSAE